MVKKQKPQTVRLNLTVEEAQTLFDVCCSIGGDPITTRRRYTNSIKCQLEATGKINTNILNSMRDMNPSHREIRFVEKTW